jgi:molybdenum cofactor biosynthesis protein B
MAGALIMAHLTQRSFVSLNIAVLTISDTRTFDTDTSGQTLVDRLERAGHVLIDRGLVIDDIYQIRARVSQWIADPQVQVVLMTGGTGFTARDNTPQAVLPLLDKQVDGFGELFRQVSLAEIGMSTLQSRAACPVRPARAVPPGTRFWSVNWTAAPARATSLRTSSPSSNRRSAPVRRGHEHPRV